MAQLPAQYLPQGYFDASQVEPSSFNTLPAGWYIAKIIESETKETNDKQGEMLVLTLEVIDGEFAGRRLWDRLNLKNANPTAEKIGWGTLSAICRATDKFRIQNSEELHGIPFKVKVAVRAAGDGKDGKYYDESNQIKAYKPLNDQVKGSQVGSAPPAGAGAPPWAPPTKPPPPAAPPMAQGSHPATAGAPPWQKPAAPAPAAPPAQPAPPQEAIDWAKANPQHPEAAPILAYLQSIQPPPPPPPPTWTPPAAGGPPAAAAPPTPPWARK